MNSDNKRSLQLDFLRGIAILLAMGWHLNTYTGSMIFDIFMIPGRTVGWAGVDVFFVLSGFLVGRLIFIELNETGNFEYGKFLIRRVFRLWPVLYFYIIVQLLVGDKPYKTYFWQVFFHMQNYFATTLPHLWSLAVEEHFYLFAGLVLPLCARRQVRPLQYVIGLAAIIPICLILRFWGYAAGMTHQELHTYTHFRADALAAGVLLAVVQLHWPDIFLKFSRQKLLMIAIAAISGVVLWLIGDGSYSGTIAFTVAIIGSVALLFAVYEWKYPKYLSPIVKFVAMLGFYSYSIYIWHYAFGHAAEQLALKLHYNNMIFIDIARYVVAIVGSIIISKIIERPAIALRDKIFPRKTSINMAEFST